MASYDFPDRKIGDLLGSRDLAVPNKAQIIVILKFLGDSRNRGFRLDRQVNFDG